jgi:hypothetical protein
MHVEGLTEKAKHMVFLFVKNTMKIKEPSIFTFHSDGQKMKSLNAATYRERLVEGR